VEARIHGQGKAPLIEKKSFSKKLHCCDLAENSKFSKKRAKLARAALSQ
jgi:hypothetical protein